MEYDYFLHRRFGQGCLYRFPKTKIQGGQVASALSSWGWRGNVTREIQSNWISISRNEAQKCFPIKLPPEIKRYNLIKLLKEVGFVVSYESNLHTSRELELYEWNGIKVSCSKKDKVTMEEFVKRIANQAAYVTRTQIKNAMNRIEFGETGYKPKAHTD